MAEKPIEWKNSLVPPSKTTPFEERHKQIQEVARMLEGLKETEKLLDSNFDFQEYLGNKEIPLKK